MDKPYTIAKHPLLTDDEKDKFLDFMIEWALFYGKVDWGDIHISAIIEKSGMPKKEFDELVLLYRGQNVLEAIKNTWKYSNRPLTSREICSMLSNKFSETNIKKQIGKLCRNGYLKVYKARIMGKDILFYYLPIEKKDN